MSIYPFQPYQLNNFVEYLIAEATLLPHEAENIKSLWDNNKIEQAALDGGINEDQLRKSKVMAISSENETNWLFKRLGERATEANKYYGFDLNGFFEPLQLASYSIEDHFDWHLDFGVGHSSKRKLSIVIQLSDTNDYEGGDLEFQINNKTVKAPRSKGTAIIFPSFIRHRVTKITKGTRYSLVGWVSGNPFR